MLRLVEKLCSAARLLPALCAAFAAAACGNMQWRAPAPVINSAHSEVPGILEHAEKNGKSRIVVFSTHGMGPTERCYADPIVERFAGTPLAAGPFGCVSASGGQTARATVMPVCLDRNYHVAGEALAPEDERYLGLECGTGAPPVDIQSDQVPEKGHSRSMLFSRFGLLLRQDVTTSFKGKEIPVTIFSHYWNSDAWWLQQPYVHHDLELSDAAKLNKFIKEGMINRGFSDAVLYNGPFGAVMRKGTQNALCLMVLEAEPQHPQAGTSHTHSAPCAMLGSGQMAGLRALESVQLAYLSESLGSRLLFDALDETATLRNDESQAVRAIADQIVGSDPIIYMSANQLPLLGLARLQVQETPEAWMKPEALRSEQTQNRFLRRYLLQAAREDHGNEIVAFHDPNDLLGYRAGAHLRSPLEKRIIEVTQHYARPLGILANPYSAHNQSFRNSISRRIILCGAKRRAGGALMIPKSCK